MQFLFSLFLLFFLSFNMFSANYYTVSSLVILVRLMLRSLLITWNLSPDCSIMHFLQRIGYKVQLQFSLEREMELEREGVSLTNTFYLYTVMHLHCRRLKFELVSQCLAALCFMHLGCWNSKFILLGRMYLFGCAKLE